MEHSIVDFLTLVLQLCIFVIEKRREKTTEKTQELCNKFLSVFHLDLPVTFFFFLILTHGFFFKLLFKEKGRERL